MKYIIIALVLVLTLTNCTPQTNPEFLQQANQNMYGPSSQLMGASRAGNIGGRYYGAKDFFNN